MPLMPIIHRHLEGNTGLLEEAKSTMTVDNKVCWKYLSAALRLEMLISIVCIFLVCAL